MFQERTRMQNRATQKKIDRLLQYSLKKITPLEGSVKKITPFKFYPKRNIGDQFMNVNNDIATIVLACNNDITLGDTSSNKIKPEGGVIYIP